MPEHEHYQLVISRRAAYQMSEHAAFAARLDERYAQKLMVEFQTAAESLTCMPYRAPYLNSDSIPKGMFRKLVFSKWYLILYKIRDNTVYIEYVVDGRQDYTWLIQ